MESPLLYLFLLLWGKKGVYSISLKEVVGFFIVGAMQSIKLAECSSHKDVSDGMRFEKALNLTVLLTFVKMLKTKFN